MGLFKQFTHVSVTVTDLAKAREFYSDTLVERETIRAQYPHFALWTDDCDATAARIESLGLVTRDVVSGPTGLRQVFVKDPDGNMVECIGPSQRAGARVMESAGTQR